MLIWSKWLALVVGLQVNSRVCVLVEHIRVVVVIVVDVVIVVIVYVVKFCQSVVRFLRARIISATARETLDYFFLVLSFF